MRKYIALLLLLSCGIANAANFSRSDYNVDQKDYTYQANRAVVFGKLLATKDLDAKPDIGREHSAWRACGKSDNDTDKGDLILRYDISGFARLAGDAFDVNKIYVDGIGIVAKHALGIWILDFQRHHLSAQVHPIVGDRGDDKHGPWYTDWKNNVSVCIGSVVQVATLNSALENIVLWYDGPLERKVSSPVSDGTNTGDTTTPIRNGVPPKPGLAYGSGSSKPATDSPSSGKPNFVGKSIRLFDTSGRERYTFKKTESIVAKCEIANNGTKNIPSDEDVTTMFLLSKGYKEDPHGDWKKVGTEETKSSSIEVGERQTEDDFVHLKDYPDVLPGSVHNIVCCADRKERDNNNGGEFEEIHESDNCTSEAVFEVEGTYNFLANLAALSNNQPKPGESFSYTAGIGNTLDQPSEDVAVALYISPNQDWNGRWLVDSFMIPASSLPTGGSFWKNGTLIAPSSGEYTLWLCVNPHGTIPETIGSDNCKSQWFKVKSELNFSLSNLTLPKQSFTPGERMMATVTANTSGGDSSQDVEVSFWTTPRGWELRKLVDTVVIPAQYMKESAGPVTWNSNQIPVPVPENYTLWACINPKGVNPEVNGEDNCKTAWFNVADPNPPTQAEVDEDEEAAILLLQMSQTN